MLIDGSGIASEIRTEIRSEVDQWVSEGNRAPYLAVVLVGNDPASASYVRGKTRACNDAGINSDTILFDDSVTEENLLAEIERLNNDSGVDGILVQLPLPDQIDEQKVIRAIDPRKDVDGFHPVNVGNVVLGQPGFAPATPAGILELLRRTGTETSGKNAVVIGRSNIVGKPVLNLLLQKGTDATVTICHSRTRNLADITRNADILIAAIGRAHFVKADMVKDGAVVIDVGINRVEDASRERGYRLVGDVDFDAVLPIASHITPVPKGVGPMTIAMLLKNTLQAARSLNENS